MYDTRPTLSEAKNPRARWALRQKSPGAGNAGLPGPGPLGIGQKFVRMTSCASPRKARRRLSKNQREEQSPFALQSSPAACTAGAHEARALWAKQREVSPMKQGVPQASLRASEAAKRLEPRGHGAKRSPQGRNTAQALAQGGAKVWDDHAELRGAWTRNTPRRKIPFSRAKIVSLQFPRPEIRRILAETGGAHEGRAQCAKQAVVSPVKQGAPRVSLRTSEARRAGVASTRSKAQCAATEHRASVSAGRCEDAERPC